MNKLVIFAIVAAVLALVITFLDINFHAIIASKGYHRHIINQAPGPCRQIHEITHGSEDVSDLGNGKLAISSGLRSGAKFTSPLWKAYKGNIFLFDMKNPDAKPMQFNIVGSFDTNMFTPLGTTKWIEKGIIYLYVVNVTPNTTTVERFRVDIENVTLTHEATLTSDKFTLVNSIVAVGFDQFYFTNSLGTYGQSIWLIILEFLFRLPWTNVGYYNKGEVQIVADHISIANGLTLSRDERFVYVVSCGHETIIVYNRNKNNSLTEIQRFPIYMMGDNVKTDPETGDIWAAGHPVGHLIEKYEEDPRTQAPSLVLKLTVKDGYITGATQIYANDGTELVAGSVAYPYKGGVIGGSVGGHPIYCKLWSQ